MPRVSWLDSTRMPSGIHICIEGSSTTLCGYEIELHFSSKRWIPFRVGNHRTHKCQRCHKLANEQKISTKGWDRRVPERDSQYIEGSI